LAFALTPWSIDALAWAAVVVATVWSTGASCCSACAVEPEGKDERARLATMAVAQATYLSASPLGLMLLQTPCGGSRGLDGHETLLRII
jgi:hypothetical protein